MKTSRCNVHARKDGGFSLVELMLAMVLGILVIFGLIQVFSAIRASFQTQQSLSFVQETGRFSMETLKPELRDAGKLDFCIAELNVRNLLDPTGTGFVSELFDPAVAIIGWQYDTTSAGDTLDLVSTTAVDNTPANWVSTTGTDLPAAISALAVAGTDVLMVKSADAVEGLTACNNNVSNSASININYPNNCPGGLPVRAPLTAAEMDDVLPQEGIILVTDCSSGGDLFQRSNQSNASSMARGSGAAGGDPGNVSPGGNNWSATYGDSMQVFTVSTTVYFIGVGTSGEPSLFRMDFGTAGTNSAPVELAEGIETLQIRFGVTDAFGNITYQEPDNVADPLNIMSISVSMLIRSVSLADNTFDTASFDLEGVTVNAPGTDRRIRKVFSTTVAVRNRINVL